MCSMPACLLSVFAVILFLDCPVRAHNGALLTSTFFNGSPSLLRANPGEPILAEFYGTDCPRLLSTASLPCSGGSEMFEWVKDRVDQYLRCNDLPFTMKNRICPGHVEKEYKVYGSRVELFGLCQRVYGMLLYNYCLGCDICNESSSVAKEIDALCDELRKTACINLYLSATSVYMLSWVFKMKKEGATQHEKQQGELRRAFEEKYGLGGSEPSHVKSGACISSTRVDSSSPGHAGQQDEPVSSSQANPSAGATHLEDGSASKSGLSASRASSPAFGDGEADLFTPLSFLLYVYKTRLQDARSGYTLRTKRNTQEPAVFLFLLDEYRDLLHDLLDEVLALASHLKSHPVLFK